MLTGVLFALAAGLMWGLVFVAPVLLPQYPAALQSFGRYLAFGLIALPLAWWDRRRLAQLQRADWLEALKLALVGNIVYYLFLASAIQHAGAPLPTLIIGTLPVVIALASRALAGTGDVHLPWQRLLPSLLLIGAGLALVNHAEAQALRAGGAFEPQRHALGALLALGALACWTWYPIRNARWLRAHPGRSARVWATAQGLATLPAAAAGYALFWAWPAGAAPGFVMPLGPTPGLYLGLMLGIGLFASWLGTLCWNEASQRLPPALSSQLIVFETMAALAYAFLLRQQWPAWPVALGIALLIAGVCWAVRAAAAPLLPEGAPH